MTKTNVLLLTVVLAIVALAILALPQAASANPTYFGLVPADKQANGCNLCHEGAPPALNAIGKKVQAAAPGDKSAMAALLSGDSPGNAISPGNQSSGNQATAAAPAPQKISQTSYKKVNVALGKNGKQQEVKAVIAGEVTLVPIRDMVQLLGGNLAWDAKSMTATYDDWRGTVSSFNTRTKVVRVNDREYQNLDLKIIDNRVYLPLAFLGERLDTQLQVKFEQNNDLGKRTIIEAKWSQSAHVTPVASPVGRDTCVSCHNGDGFAQGVTKIADLKDVDEDDYKGQYCTTCHGDRGLSIRNGGVVTLANGITANMGRGALCASCHNSRRNNYDLENMLSGKSAPHNGPQADVLTATGGMEFEGHIYPSSPHNANPNTCVTCHMAKDENGVSNHTWDVKQALPCGSCHDGLATVNRTALGDYDGDGTIEGIQDEVQGLVHLVEEAIKEKLGGGSFGESHGSFVFYNAAGEELEDVSPEIYKAAWNLVLVEKDGSKGIHNPAYVVTLLQQSYRALTGQEVPNARIR